MKLKYKIIKEGQFKGYTIPLSIIIIDIKDILACEITPKEAIKIIAKTIKGPAGYNIFDMEAVTTTSDGIMTQGAIILMGASDNGIINPEFGFLEMEEMPFSQELVEQEPHLYQWEALYRGKKLFRGPNPAKKLIPVHNVVITGRASNNNSATEMMNIVTMDEILLPILGQIEIVMDGDIILGYTGEEISVGIGMTVAEKYGRVFPIRQFKAGETAHGSGEYAKTLKETIPCIVADKKILASHIIDALEIGMIPGVHIGCSPAVLSVAKYMNMPIGLDNISEAAYEELASIGITKEWLMEPVTKLSREGIIEEADKIIPGVKQPVKLKVSDIVNTEYI